MRCMVKTKSVTGRARVSRTSGPSESVSVRGSKKLKHGNEERDENYEKLERESRTWPEVTE